MMRQKIGVGLFGLISLSSFIFMLAIDNSAAQEAINLRSQAASSHLTLGTAVQYEALSTDPQYGQVLAREFEMLVPENALKMRDLRPTQGAFDFTAADHIINFAESNDMMVRGATLVWYQALPTWMRNRTFTPDELMGIMQQHISTVVGRYRGRIYAWDVVNEAVNGSGTGFRPSVYYDTLGPDFVEMAFRWAHEADPDALLFYNDFNGEELNAKSDYIYKLVKSLVDKNVPIHGVGLQMHLTASIGLDMDELAANIQRIADLGLQVHITEMDVQIRDYPGDTAAKLAAQAELYRQVTAVCSASPACTALITWGFTDKYSWIDQRFGADDPLLFDENFQPKPAAFALSEALGDGGVVPEPAPGDDPAVIVETNPPIAIPGDSIAVTVRLRNVSDLYGLQTDCRVDPNILSATGFDGGEAFTLLDSFYVGQTAGEFDPATGQWLVAVSRLQPAPAFSGSGTAFTMRYQATQVGNPAVTCSILAVDHDGGILPLTIVQANQTIIQPSAPAEPDVPAEIPPVNVSDGILGIVKYQSRPDASGIKVELLDISQSVLREIITSEDGGYNLSDIALGEYTLRFSGPQHLDLLHPIVVSASDSLVQVESNRLMAGDIDGNGTIDIVDAMYVAANLGVDALAEISHIDLNADNVINVRDLVLVGSNFGLVGPVVRAGL